MSIENQDIFTRDDEDAATGAAVIGALPAPLVLTQRCAAELRAYLADAKLAHYRIFHCPSAELYDIERTLEALDEVSAWESVGALIADGEQIHAVTHDEAKPTLWEGGVLRLAKHEVVLARWYWIDADQQGGLRVLWLVASTSPQKYFELRQKVTAIARRQRLDSCQIVRGYAWADGEPAKREMPSELMLSDDIQRRVELEVLGFFADEAAELYRALRVPYRRGVLLHGPPGNGKTSLIRYIGAKLPNVSAMLLRGGDNFDTGDMEEIIRRWTAQAPAVLVIEDLNWLIEKLDVSTFLNLLDGLDSKTGAGGLLLIATSNHPEQLDPALNNRPGRFDVVLEVPPPNYELRMKFFTARLCELDARTVQRVAARSDGLSFAHLQEILRLSGVMAIRAGRRQRSIDDVLTATRTVNESRDEAVRGFPAKPEVPFGLLPLREWRKQEVS